MHDRLINAKMETKRVIELKNVSIYQGEVSRKANAENNLVLSNVNLTVDEGEFVYLIGRVGTGKSTLLKTLYAEVEPAEGSVDVVGFDLCNLKRRDIPMLRRSMGIVFQDFQLLTDRNVFLNLYDVMRATGWRNEEDIRCRIDEVLKLKRGHELSDHIIDRNIKLINNPLSINLKMRSSITRGLNCQEQSLPSAVSSMALYIHFYNLCGSGNALRREDSQHRVYQYRF